MRSEAMTSRQSSYSGSLAHKATFGSFPSRSRASMTFSPLSISKFTSATLSTGVVLLLDPQPLATNPMLLGRSFCHTDLSLTRPESHPSLTSSLDYPALPSPGQPLAQPTAGASTDR